MSFTFGGNGELFGVYHAPAGEGDRGVVFCAPFAEEKKCSYRTFAGAARAFAADGTACLRFDYFGTGDSCGRFSEFSPSRAADDIAAAADELRERAGVSRVVLLGLRLGGTMALAAAPRAGADSVILWQPVLSGKSFFDLTIKRQMLRKQLIGSDGGESSAEIIDLDGFAVSKAAAEQIRALDCAAAAADSTGPIRLLQISHSVNVSREYRTLAEILGGRVSVATVKCPPFWNRIDLTDTTPVIEKTIDWLKR